MSERSDALAKSRKGTELSAVLGEEVDLQVDGNKGVGERHVLTGGRDSRRGLMPVAVKLLTIKLFEGDGALECFRQYCEGVRAVGHLQGRTHSEMPVNCWTDAFRDAGELLDSC